MRLKVLYAGSPAASAQTLELLLQKAASEGENCFEIVGVLTNPPKAQGRHKTLVATPVQEVAEKHALRVFAPEKLDASAREEISSICADLLVCFAYGKIFGPKFLALFGHGGINLHPSLLPRYRGATPIPAAIFNRDTETAVTVQTLAQKMDEGDILAQEKISLDFTETSGSLLAKSAEIGARLLAEVLAATAQTGLLPEGAPQTGEASYTTILTKESGRIDWKRSAVEIDAQIRACTPEPGAWTSDGNGVIKILRAKAAASGAPGESNETEAGTVTAFEKSEGIFVATGNGTLVIEQLQRQGKSALAAKDFMNGARNFVGTVFL